jgi:hypothetical protein
MGIRRKFGATNRSQIPYPLKSQTPPNTLAVEAKVCELIDLVHHGWNLPLIRSVFWKEEADLICSIPLSRYSNPEKKIVWHANTSGEFTVTSAYYLKKERKGSTHTEGSQQLDKVASWKFIWNLQIPNATKVFLWRTCNDILPMKLNLCSRGVLKVDKCPLLL